MGPMAQDFKKAFGLGSEESMIDTIDADGVILAGIQALGHAEVCVHVRVRVFVC
jgi:hypothetical protein